MRPEHPLPPGLDLGLFVDTYDSDEAYPVGLSAGLRAMQERLVRTRSG